ncbi:hypothetical protein LWM68_37890 [Niabella sp. W65]|nr:hypothetical protein [Niabella sp. W65]MCH7368009.1 hypothetical protein [Niabella sp. W65]
MKYLHIAHDNADDPSAKAQVAEYIKGLGGTPGVPAAGGTTPGATPAADSTKTSASGPKNKYNFSLYRTPHFVGCFLCTINLELEYQ